VNFQQALDGAGQGLNTAGRELEQFLWRVAIFYIYSSDSIGGSKKCVENWHKYVLIS
jgi:hypothetical protein